MPVLFASFFVVVAGCVVALGFAAVSLSARRRPKTLARYPLQIVSWAIALPFFVLSLLGTFVSGGLGTEDGDRWSWVFAAMGLGTAACCAIAVAMCSRAARGKYARGPRIPAILGFGAPLLALLWVGGLSGGGGELTAFGLLVSAGAGVNGLLAVRINEARRQGPFVSSEDATLPPLGASPLGAAEPPALD